MMATDFNHLRNEARERGRRDAFRWWESAKDLGYPKPVNPHKAGMTTEEDKEWQQGFDDEISELETK